MFHECTPPHAILTVCHAFACFEHQGIPQDCPRMATFDEIQAKRRGTDYIPNIPLIPIPQKVDRKAFYHKNFDESLLKPLKEVTGTRCTCVCGAGESCGCVVLEAQRYAHTAALYGCLHRRMEGDYFARLESCPAVKAVKALQPRRPLQIDAWAGGRGPGWPIVQSRFRSGRR